MSPIEYEEWDKASPVKLQFVGRFLPPELQQPDQWNALGNHHTYEYLSYFRQGQWGDSAMDMDGVTSRFTKYQIASNNPYRVVRSDRTTHIDVPADITHAFETLHIQTPELMEDRLETMLVSQDGRTIQRAGIRRSLLFTTPKDRNICITTIHADYIGPQHINIFRSLPEQAILTVPQINKHLMQQIRVTPSSVVLISGEWKGEFVPDTGSTWVYWNDTRVTEARTWVDHMLGIQFSDEGSVDDVFQPILQKAQERMGTMY